MLKNWGTLKGHVNVFHVVQQDIKRWFQRSKEHMASSTPVEKEIRVVYQETNIPNKVITWCLRLKQNIYAKQ